MQGSSSPSRQLPLKRRGQDSVRTTILKLLTVLCVVSTTAWGANISGKWAIKVPMRRYGDIVLILQMNQAGNKISGTLVPDRGDISTGSPQSNEIFDAKIEGNILSFYVWRGTDQPAKQMYKGVISDDQIEFTVTGGPLQPAWLGPPPAATQTFKAVRVP